MGGLIRDSQQTPLSRKPLWEPAASCSVCIYQYEVGYPSRNEELVVWQQQPCAVGYYTDGLITALALWLSSLYNFAQLRLSG